MTLRDEEAFIESARAYAVLTLDNKRLGAEAAALLDEVRESRSRIQASADDERRRVERDLHDGAQQRLVALRIKLELAAERIDGSDHRSARLIRELGGDVDSALDEIRSLARGIYPSPLADRGLVEALRSAALQTVLPAVVHANGTRGRYPRPVESAAYFCCLEAMQNAAKHADGAKQPHDRALRRRGPPVSTCTTTGQTRPRGKIAAGVGLGRACANRSRASARTSGSFLAVLPSPHIIERVPAAPAGLPHAVPHAGMARAPIDPLGAAPGPRGSGACRGHTLDTSAPLQQHSPRDRAPGQRSGRRRREWPRARALPRIQHSLGGQFFRFARPSLGGGSFALSLAARLELRLGGMS